MAVVQLSSIAMSGKISMLRLLLAILILAGGSVLAQDPSTIVNASSPEISYVMEPFESTGGQDWWKEDSCGDCDAIVDITTEEFLMGNASLRVEYTLPMNNALQTIKSYSRQNASSSTADDRHFLTVAVNVGFVQGDRPHNCHGTSFISLWYKAIEPFSSASKIAANATTSTVTTQLKLTLLDDSHCFPDGAFCFSNETGLHGESLEHYSYSTTILTTLNDDNLQSDWQELRIPVEDLILDPSKGPVGNGQLDLDRLRGWQVQLLSLVDSPSSMLMSNPASNSSLAEATSNEEKDNVFKMTFLLDQLACIGGGDMLGAAFHQGNDISWDRGVEEGLWVEEYYQSELAKNHTTVALQDGRLSLDYTVQMQETWGGFNGFTFLAPGDAYYNLTGATDWHLSYRTREAASVPGRTHLRIVVAESSDCTSNCSADVMLNER